MVRKRPRAKGTSSAHSHGRQGLQRVYHQHRYVEEMREALMLWAARLRGIVEPPAANVVDLASVRAR